MHRISRFFESEFNKATLRECKINVTLSYKLHQRKIMLKSKRIEHAIYEQLDYCIEYMKFSRLLPPSTQNGGGLEPKNNNKPHEISRRSKTS